MRKESMVQEKLIPPPPPPQPALQAKPNKKSKKKFARHKIRSESPDNDFKDLDDMADTQVAASESKTTGKRVSTSIPEENYEAKSKEGDTKSEAGAEEENIEENEEDDDFDESVSIHVSKYVGPKDTPLERRALLSLEKQLELEVPDSKLDFKVKQFYFQTLSK